MAWHDMSLKEAQRVTIAEWDYYQKAHRVRQQENERLRALQAWFNQTVQATTGSGRSQRPLYKTFTDFYDNNKQFETIFIDEYSRPQKTKIMDKNSILNDL